MVEPVSERIRARLELREKVPGRVPCMGPRVAEDTFSFEAAHFIPERDAWEGVLTDEPERLINRHTGRSKRHLAENEMRETLDEYEGAAQDLFEVCVVPSGVCVATSE